MYLFKLFKNRKVALMIFKKIHGPEVHAEKI